MFVGFAVLMAVVMKSSVVWDLMPCSSLKSQSLWVSRDCKMLYPRRQNSSRRCSFIPRFIKLWSTLPRTSQNSQVLIKIYKYKCTCIYTPFKQVCEFVRFTRNAFRKRICSRWRMLLIFFFVNAENILQRTVGTDSLSCYLVKFLLSLYSSISTC